MRLVNLNDLLSDLRAKNLLTDEIESVAKGLKVYATTQIMYPEILLEDDCFPGKPRRVGDDHHDWLEIVDGHLEYRNMQNGDGTGECGCYHFKPSWVSPDSEGYCCPKIGYVYAEGEEDDLTPEQQEHEYKVMLAKHMEEKFGKKIENPDDIIIMS